MPAYRIADDLEPESPSAARDSLWHLFQPFHSPSVGFVTLRVATVADHDLIEGLYLESMALLLTALGEFDAGAVRRRLRAVHRMEDTRIVMADGRSIGWLEIAATPDRLTLHQIHLIAEVRERGLGTKLVSRLKAVARLTHRPVTLYVIKNNPAQRLYERLGFRVTRRIGTKWQMRFDPSVARPA